MRRERKQQIREIAAADILARWQEGQADFSHELKKFARDTDATAEEMTRFTVFLEDEIIRYMQKGLDTAKRFKPTLHKLCQKLYEIEDRVWNTSLVTRIDEFNAIVHAWKIHYYDRIVEATIELYRDMLIQGVTYTKIMWRIQYGKDAFHMHEGARYMWAPINARLKAWLKIATGKIKGELQQFVEDAQNIHTTPITGWTNVTLKLLMATPVPEGQKTMAEIQREWRGLSFVVSVTGSVVSDMREWGAKAWVVEDGDYLYRRTLQHLWAKIKGYPTEVRCELVKRLYEECRDAVGLCAQGHVARLANVLVGFDDAFKGEVSLQDRMAEISRQTTAGDEKRAAAAVILNDFNVADSDRAAWLDAFGD